MNVFCQPTQFDTLKIDWLFSVCWTIMFLMYQCKYVIWYHLYVWVSHGHICRETFCHCMFPFLVLGVTKRPLSGFGNTLDICNDNLFPLFGPISQTWEIVPLLLRDSFFVGLCPSINQICWVVYMHLFLLDCEVLCKLSFKRVL